MRLILIRHGETTENRRKVSMGHGQGTLTRKGLLQHRKLARLLSGEKIDALYSSDLRRTALLAKAIQAYHPLPIQYRKALRERNMGIFEGKPWGSIDAYAKAHGLDRFSFIPPRGESIVHLHQRVARFIDTIIRKYRATDQTILLPTHGGFIRNMIIHVLRLGLPAGYAQKYRQLNASITAIDVDKRGRATIRRANSVRHLSPCGVLHN